MSGRHFLVECGEFEDGRERLMEMVGVLKGLSLGLRSGGEWVRKEKCFYY